MKNLVEWLLLSSLLLLVLVFVVGMFKNTFRNAHIFYAEDEVSNYQSKNIRLSTGDKKNKNMYRNKNSNSSKNSRDVARRIEIKVEDNSGMSSRSYKSTCNSYKEYKKYNRISR